MHHIMQFFAEIRQKIVRGGGVKKPVKFSRALVAIFVFAGCSLYANLWAAFSPWAGFGFDENNINLGSPNHAIKYAEDGITYKMYEGYTCKDGYGIYNALMSVDSNLNNITKSGVQFCPVMIKIASDGTFSYAHAASWGAKDAGCVWLCADGYIGEKCRDEYDSRRKYFVDPTTSLKELYFKTGCKSGETCPIDSLVIEGQSLRNDVNWINPILMNGDVTYFLVVQRLLKKGAQVKLMGAKRTNNGNGCTYVPVMHDTNGTTKTVCLSGYHGDECTKYSNNPCGTYKPTGKIDSSNSYVVDVAEHYGETTPGKYIYTGELKCDYDNMGYLMWVPPKDGDNNTIKCAPGYYGKPNINSVKYTVFFDGSLGWSASGCNKCTNPGFGTEGTDWEWGEPTNPDGTAATMCVIKQIPKNTENNGCPEGQVLFGTSCYVPFVDENGNSFIVPESTTCEMGTSN